jgi:DNA-binding NarL/FixJ family response regulator
MIYIAIVDDKQPNRISLAEKLELKSDMAVLFTASNGIHFLEEMKSREAHPDVVLMDIDMPEMDGVEAVRAGAQLYPSTKFIMLTVFDDDNKVFEAIQAGAIGYLLKDEKTEVIEEAIRQVIEFGGSPMSPRIARKALSLLMNAKVEFPQKQESVLSEREMEILKGLVDGLDYRAVAEKLFISPLTVRTHITNIYRKLHVTSKTQAVKLAIKNRWV